MPDRRYAAGGTGAIPDENPPAAAAKRIGDSLPMRQPEEIKAPRSAMDGAANVAAQYREPENPAARTRLRALYSTNPVGWVPWLFAQYGF